MISITEIAGSEDLENLSIEDIVGIMNSADKTVAEQVEKSLPAIQKLIHQAYSLMKSGGRLFYIGSGTSGRLGIVDASECPPTFGVPDDCVIGIISGGDKAIRKAVEFAEDNPNQGWLDLMDWQICDKDFLIGISANGNNPYVSGALHAAKKAGIYTGCIVCNPSTKMAELADFPIEIIVGPEVIAGSTRLKAGTAQKMVLNMISTTVMIKLGHVQGNKMIDMQLTNKKLIDRGARIIMEKFNLDIDKAEQLLLKFGSVRKAIVNIEANLNAESK